MYNPTNFGESPSIGLEDMDWTQLGPMNGMQ